MARTYPQVVISAEGESWLNKGQLWMYRNNLVRTDQNVQNGEPVDIVNETGRYLGSGFYSLSHIVVRILSKNPQEVIDRAFFAQRIRFAYAYRKTVESGNLENCRLIFAEADQLPGLVVDRYHDILVTQISSYGMEQIKDMLYELLLSCLEEDGQKIKGIYERNEIAVRTKEGLPLYQGFWRDANLPVTTIINENGLQMHIDVEHGQKTGYFLDQKSNRMIVRKLAANKTVLDCFTNSGGFALNAAMGNAYHVTAVDVSKTALDQARENALLNGLIERMDFVQADVFDYLDQCATNQYDMIILDPPAFTKSRSTVNRAYNGYKRINARAMELLQKGGYLATCSCSRFMENENFEKMLLEAAQEAGVLLRQISVTQQNADHPILWTMNETSYLKFYVFQIL